MSTLILYQFPVSHYCEKVRWALDLKGLAYTQKNLMPGAHIKVVRRWAPRSSVPLLIDGQQAIQGSSAILDYLDQQYPAPSLCPQNQLNQAKAWERRLDQELGGAIRTFVYYHLLDRPDILVPWLAAGQPFYQSWLLRLFFPKVAQMMRDKLGIHAAGAATAQKVIEQLLAEIAPIYQAGDYLAGPAFSRADLTAGALFAPLFMPAAYGLDWGQPELPPNFRHWLKAHQTQLEAVQQMYLLHRQPI